jgi:CubicO group peptidase (beta-lactamase class C family)
MGWFDVCAALLVIALVKCLLKKLLCLPFSVDAGIVHVECSNDVRDNPINQAIMRLVTSQVECGRETGMQVTVYWKGVRVANVWASAASSCHFVKEDSLFMGFSVSKGVAATTLALCVERKEVSFEDPVSKYWSKFAEGNKKTVTVEVTS